MIEPGIFGLNRRRAMGVCAVIARAPVSVVQGSTPSPVFIENTGAREMGRRGNGGGHIVCAKAVAHSINRPLPARKNVDRYADHAAGISLLIHKT